MSQYSDSKLNLDNQYSNWYKAFHLIKSNTKVLDVGCSNGNFGKELIEQKGCIVDGIEIDENDALDAKKILRNVYILDAERDPLPESEKYDVIFLGDVIEHFAYPIETLAKLRKTLKDDGRLVFSMPNMVHMSVRIMIMSGRIEYGEKGLMDRTHLHLYNAEEITRVLNAAGFKIEELEYTAKPVPFEYVDKKLKEMGLTANNKFKSIAETPGAAAYQYIGYAKKGKVVDQKINFRSPKDSVIADDYIKQAVSEHKENYKKLEKKYSTLKEDYAALKTTKEKLKKEIIEIKSSRLWKATQAIKRTVKPIKNINKHKGSQ